MKESGCGARKHSSLSFGVLLNYPRESLAGRAEKRAAHDPESERPDAGRTERHTNINSLGETKSEESGQLIKKAEEAIEMASGGSMAASQRLRFVFETLRLHTAIMAGDHGYPV